MATYRIKRFSKYLSDKKKDSKSHENYKDQEKILKDKQYKDSKPVKSDKFKSLKDYRKSDETIINDKSQKIKEEKYKPLFTSSKLYEDLEKNLKWRKTTIEGKHKRKGLNKIKPLASSKDYNGEGYCLSNYETFDKERKNLKNIIDKDFNISHPDILNKFRNKIKLQLNKSGETPGYIKQASKILDGGLDYPLEVINKNKEKATSSILKNEKLKKVIGSLGLATIAGTGLGIGIKKYNDKRKSEKAIELVKNSFKKDK